MGFLDGFFRVATAAFYSSKNLRTFNFNIRTMVWVTKDDGVVSSILPQSDVPAEQRKATKSATTVDYLSGLDILSRGASVRLSGIVCTIGPASKATDFLVQMIDTGMDVTNTMEIPLLIAGLPPSNMPKKEVIIPPWPL